MLSPVWRQQPTQGIPRKVEDRKLLPELQLQIERQGVPIQQITEAVDMQKCKCSGGKTRSYSNVAPQENLSLRSMYVCMYVCMPGEILSTRDFSRPRWKGRCQTRCPSTVQQHSLPEHFSQASESMLLMGDKFRVATVVQWT